MPWFQPAVIFLGALGGTTIALVSVYICLKKGCCFCDVQEGTVPTEIKTDYVQVATEEDATDSIVAPSLVSSPPDISTAKRAVALSNPELAFPRRKDALPDDPAIETRPMTRQLSQSLESFGDVPKISATLQYSRKDMFLVVAIHHVEGLEDRHKSINNQVRVNAVLLPDKKFRVRSRYVSADNPVIDTKFKFSNVTRSALFQSALRLRLYGRTVRVGIQAGRERCIGEVTIHLADVAQREDALKTLRPLASKKKPLKKL